MASLPLPQERGAQQNHGADMTLDENAAAFGLFQLAFANLHQQLATLVFFLRRIQQPDVKFDEVFALQSSRLRKALKEELSRLEQHSSTQMELQLLRKTCSDIGPLAQWRNARSHPRVRIDGNRIAIFDWRTGQPLSVRRDECVQKILETIRITVDLEVYGATLCEQLDPEKEKQRGVLIDEIFKMLDDWEGTAQ